MLQKWVKISANLSKSLGKLAFTDFSWFSAHQIIFDY